MSKIIKVKVGEMRRLKDIIDNAGLVQIHDRDDKTAYQKWKWATGKMHENLNATIKIAQKDRNDRLAAVLDADPDFSERMQASLEAFEVAKEKLITEFAAADQPPQEKGAPPQVIIDPKRVHEYQQRVKDLEAEHAEALEHRRVVESLMKAHDEEEYPLDVYEFRMGRENVPLNMASGYITALEFMIAEPELSVLPPGE